MTLFILSEYADQWRSGCRSRHVRCKEYNGVVPKGDEPLVMDAIRHRHIDGV